MTTTFCFLVAFIAFCLKHGESNEDTPSTTINSNLRSKDCDLDSPCNNAVIYFDSNYCYLFCNNGQCNNLKVFFSSRCIFTQIALCAGSFCSSQDIGDNLIENVTVYHSGHFLFVELFGGRCTNCYFYVGTTNNWITDNNDDSLLITPNRNVAIDTKFVPTNGVGSKLYLISYVNGTGENFNIYCSGAVSYCMTTTLLDTPMNKSNNAFIDTKLYCDIDEYFDTTISSIYPNNIEAIDHEKDVPDEWKQDPGCHFDCVGTNGCIVKLFVTCIRFTVYCVIIVLFVLVIFFKIFGGLAWIAHGAIFCIYVARSVLKTKMSLMFVINVTPKH